MDKEISTFGNIEIEKKKFYRHKATIFSGDVDIEKVLLLRKRTINKVKPLHIMLHKISVYVKCYDGQTK